MDYGHLITGGCASNKRAPVTVKVGHHSVSWEPLAEGWRVATQTDSAYCPDHNKITIDQLHHSR